MKASRSRLLKRTAVVAVVAAAAALVIGFGVFAVFVLTYGFDTNRTQRVSGGGTQVVSIIPYRLRRNTGDTHGR